MKKELKKPIVEPVVEPKLRQILIETDGASIWIRKSEVSKIELISIMNMVVSYMTDGPHEAKKPK